MSRGPIKGFIAAQEVVKRSSNVGEFKDEFSPKVYGTEERLNVAQFSWNWPVRDSFDFVRIDGELTMRNDSSQVLNRFLFELAFDWFTRKFVFAHRLEYLFCPMAEFFKGISKNDVVHIDEDAS